MTETTIEIELNHAPARVDADIALDAALQAWGYDLDQVAVAVNETFVPRDQWSEHRLREGDRVSVLGRIVGG